MFVAPAEGTLKGFMEFGDTGCADHEQSPPHQRTHAAEHYAKLIDRNRRYRRFRHASSLPKPKRIASNLPPAISRSPSCIFHLTAIIPNDSTPWQGQQKGFFCRNQNQPKSRTSAHIGDG